MAASYLIVPGDEAELIRAAVASTAHAVVIDLSDLVADTNKVEARESTARWLSQASPNRPDIWVRINRGDTGLDDIALVVAEAGDGLTGVCVPGIDTARDIEPISRELEIIEAANEREHDPIVLCAILGTANAVLDAREIASHHRMEALSLDERALRFELGLEPAPSPHERDYREPELLTLRSLLVLGCAAAGLDQPWGAPATPDLSVDQLRESTRALRRLGFGGRATTDREHVDLINECFAQPRS